MRHQAQPTATRRDILRAGGAGLAVAASAPFVPEAARTQSAGNITRTALDSRVSVLSGGGGNVTLVETGASALLVDTGNAASSRSLDAAVEEATDHPVTTVFNTHWHPDQTGSNARFGEAGATIIAHAKTRQRLRSGYYVATEARYEAPLPEAALPVRTVHTNDALEVDGLAIEFGYLIQAHTDGDIYVRVPEHNLIVAGDVIAPELDPGFDWFGGGWLGGRVDSLALLLELSDADTRFVPGFGPVIDRSAVQAEHDLLLELFERMVEHVRLGETADDMLAAGVLDGLGRRFTDPHRLLYDLHKGFWAHHNKLMPDIV